MDSNPYASPQPPNSVAPVTTDLIVVRRLVRGPALALIALSIAAMLIDITIVQHAVFIDASLMLKEYGREKGMIWIAANVGCNSLLFVVHLIVLAGAIKMLKLRAYSIAVTSAVVSLIPFCSPIVFLGVPFGIWALVVLSKNSVRDGFWANAEP